MNKETILSPHLFSIPSHFLSSSTRIVMISILYIRVKCVFVCVCAYNFSESHAGDLFFFKRKPSRVLSQKKKKKFCIVFSVYLHARRSANIRCTTGVFFRKRGFATLQFFLVFFAPFCSYLHLFAPFLSANMRKAQLIFAQI
jgi:hypothetical protein